MAIRRMPVKPEEHFTIISNEWLRDTRVSLKARGLLALILSHRVGWNVTIESLARENPEGKAAIRTAVAELEEAGYLTRERTHGEDGKFSGYDYVVSYEPSCGNRTPSSDYPTTEKPTTEKPTTENRTQRRPIPQKTISEEDQSSESADKSARTKGTRLVEGWTPEQKHIDKIRQMRPDVDLNIEHTKFTNFWLAKTGKDATKKDWGRTWENWMLNARPDPRSQDYRPNHEKRLDHYAQERLKYMNPPTQHVIEQEAR